MSEQQTVRLALASDQDHPPEHALRDLAEALGHDGPLVPDAEGVIEVQVEAADQDAAVKRVIDAITASGADDHVEIADHPDDPRHWRRDDG